MPDETNFIRYWKVSPGVGAEYWEEFRDNKWISIGWLYGTDLRRTKFGDLTKNPDKGLLIKLLRWDSPEEEIYSDKQISKWADIIKLFHKIEIGDQVFIYDKNFHINAMGEVTGEYEFEKDFDYQHTKKVKWLKIFRNPPDNEPLDIKPILNKLEKKAFVPTVMEISEKDWNTISNHATKTSDVSIETSRAKTTFSDEILKELFIQAFDELDLKYKYIDEAITKMKQIANDRNDQLPEDWEKVAREKIKNEWVTNIENKKN